MADPASVAGLIQFTWSILKTCYDYGCQIPGAPEEARALQQDIQDLHVTLADLEALHDSQGAHNVRQHQSSKTQAFPGARFVTLCQETFLALEDLSALLLKIAPDADNKLKTMKSWLLFPHRKQKLADRLKILEKSKNKLKEYRDGNTAVFINELQESEEEKARQQVLSWISNYGAVVKHEQKLSFKSLGTGRWITRSTQWKDWNPATKPLFWLYGPSGCGKTTLCASLIVELASPATGTSGALAHYYCDANDISTICDKRAVLAGLVRQLYTSRNRLRAKQLKSLFVKSKDEPAPSESELIDVLLHLVTTHPTGPAYIVVDAVNEALEPEEMISSLLDIATKCAGKVAVLLSSTESVDRLMLGRKANSPFLKSFISLDVGARDEQKDDIRLYVNSKLSNRSNAGNAMTGPDGKIITDLRAFIIDNADDSYVFDTIFELRPVY